MRQLSISLLAGFTILAASSASAQTWGRGGSPQAGACFYEHINFGGRSFCTPVGTGSERVPSRLNDEISSIRVFGNAEVLIFRDGSMRGEARRFSTGVRDLRNAGFNDRLTSFVVQPRGYDSWGGSYGNDRYGYGNGASANRGYGYPGYDNPGYGNGGYGNGAYGGGYDTGRYDNGRYGGGRPDRGRYDDGGSRWSYQQANVMVQQAYRRVFGRMPDRDAQPWVTEVLKNNWDQRELEQALRNTPEGRGR
jgi:hypothetical protein